MRKDMTVDRAFTPVAKNLNVASNLVDISTAFTMKAFIL
jgi:hypothetical protein